jgi:hypothetical protein
MADKLLNQVWGSVEKQAWRPSGAALKSVAKWLLRETPKTLAWSPETKAIGQTLWQANRPQLIQRTLGGAGGLIAAQQSGDKSTRAYLGEAKSPETRGSISNAMLAFGDIDPKWRYPLGFIAGWATPGAARRASQYGQTLASTAVKPNRSLKSIAQEGGRYLGGKSLDVGGRAVGWTAGTGAGLGSAWLGHDATVAQKSRDEQTELLAAARDELPRLKERFAAEQNPKMKDAIGKRIQAIESGTAVYHDAIRDRVARQGEAVDAAAAALPPTQADFDMRQPATGRTEQTKGTETKTTETGNFQFPNWGKAGLVGAGALGAGLLGNALFNDEEEDEETGKRKSTMPWIGPALGLGAGALGLGYLTDWQPSKLLSGDWWKGASYRPLPMIMAPYRIKLAEPFSPMPPADPPPVPPVPELPKPPDPTQAKMPPAAESREFRKRCPRARH